MSLVPSEYVGLWRRDEIVDAQGVRDATTEVYWLQSHGLYVDLRIPAARPDFRLDLLVSAWPDKHRDWLEHQEGFAGSLDVQGDLCHWQRDLDLQPPGPFDDRGRTEFLDDIHLIETGSHVNYVERWRKATLPGEQRVLALRLSPSAKARAGILVAVGNDFMYAIDWAGSIPLSVRDIDGPTADFSMFRGCEIGYGQIHGEQRWSIERCSLPVVEGTCLLPQTVAFPPVGADWMPPPQSILAEAGGPWVVLEQTYPSSFLTRG
ncbi:MAG TPA: hypothetical protein VMV35_06790 [Halothiobacillus sp.]|nr:hypothetical protein [Halothiobacillus sp.]